MTDSQETRSADESAGYLLGNALGHASGALEDMKAVMRALADGRDQVAGQPATDYLGTALLGFVQAARQVKRAREAMGADSLGTLGLTLSDALR